MPEPPKNPRILIATLGSRGDVQPYVALAAALARHGAEVVVSTGEGFDAMIETAGARARPVPINYQILLRSEDVRAALFTLRGKIRAAGQTLDLQRHIALRLFEIALDERPDLILFNVKATVVTLAARRLGVPALPTCLQPILLPTGAFPVPLFALPDWGRVWNRGSHHLAHWLMRVGLRPLLNRLKTPAKTELAVPGDLIDGHAPTGAKALSFQVFSRALVPAPDDWPDHAVSCGYWFTEPDPDYRPPEDLAAFLADGPPPVYIGFGSMPSKDPQELTRLAVEALSATGQRAVLSTGWGGLSDDVPPALRAKVHVIDKAPHSFLFPRCSAIVHHGGAGTTHEALRWGKPSLVCPVFGDQPFWAARVHAIGAGPEPLPQSELAAGRLAKALQALEDPRCLSGAQAAAQIIAGEPGADGTAARLMDLEIAVRPKGLSY
ncbi:MAG: glycosyltransferase family 1 protein [Roseibium sp.]|nr:glycosyltransferase family 1 protein [Roseibium sp.]